VHYPEAALAAFAAALSDTTLAAALGLAALTAVPSATTAVRGMVLGQHTALGEQMQMEVARTTRKGWRVPVRRLSRLPLAALTSGSTPASTPASTVRGMVLGQHTALGEQMHMEVARATRKGWRVPVRRLLRMPLTLETKGVFERGLSG